MKASGPEPPWLRCHESFEAVVGETTIDVDSQKCSIDLVVEAVANTKPSANIKTNRGFGWPTICTKFRVMPSICVFLRIGNSLPSLRNSPGSEDLSNSQ